MRILITGSRDWTYPDVIGQALLQAAYGADDITVIHGGASGADSLAGAIASMRGWKVEVHPADWTRLGKRAGMVRNALMVEAGADVCLAFIRNGSRGATVCAEMAEKAGIPVERWELTCRTTTTTAKLAVVERGLFQ